MSTPQSGRKAKKNLSVQQPSPAIFRREPSTPDEFGSPPLNMIAKNVFSHTPVEHPIGEDLSEYEISKSPANYLEESFNLVDPDEPFNVHTVSRDIFDSHEHHSSRLTHSPKHSPNTATAQITFADTSSVHQFYEKQANKSAMDAYHSPSDHFRDSLKKAATPEQLVFEHLSTASSVSSEDHMGGDGRSWQSKYSFKYGDVAWSQSDPLFPFWPVNIVDPEKMPPEIQKQFNLGTSGSSGATASGSAKLVNAQRKKIPVFLYARNDFDLIHPSKLKEYRAYREVYSRQDKMSASLKVLFAKALRLADEDVDRDVEHRVGGRAGPPLSSMSPSSEGALSNSGTPIKKKKSPFFSSDLTSAVAPPAPSLPTSSSALSPPESLVHSTASSIPLSPVREEESPRQAAAAPSSVSTSPLAAAAPPHSPFFNTSFAEEQEDSVVGPSAVAALNLSKVSEGGLGGGAEEEDVDALLAELVADDEEPATGHEEKEGVTTTDIETEEVLVTRESTAAAAAPQDDFAASFFSDAPPASSGLEGKPLLHVKSVDLSSASREVLDSDLQLPLNPRGIALGGRGVPSFNLYLSDSDTSEFALSAAPTRSLDVTPNMSPQTGTTNIGSLPPPPLAPPAAVSEQVMAPSLDIGSLGAASTSGGYYDASVEDNQEPLESDDFVGIKISDETEVEPAVNQVQEDPTTEEQQHQQQQPIMVPLSVVEFSSSDSPLSAVTAPSVTSLPPPPPVAFYPPTGVSPKAQSQQTIAAADLFGAPPPIAAAAVPFAAPPPKAAAAAADLFGAPPPASAGLFSGSTAPSITPQPVKGKTVAAVGGDAANLFGGPSAAPLPTSHGAKGPVVVVKKASAAADSAGLFGGGGGGGGGLFGSGPAAPPASSSAAPPAPFSTSSRSARGVSGTADSLFGSTSSSDAANLFGSTAAPPSAVPQRNSAQHSSSAVAAGLFDAPASRGVDASNLFGSAPPAAGFAAVPPPTKNTAPKTVVAAAAAAAAPVASLFQTGPSPNVADFFGGPTAAAPFPPPSVSAVFSAPPTPVKAASQVSAPPAPHASDFFGAAPLTPRGGAAVAVGGSGSVSPPPFKPTTSASPKDHSANFFGGGGSEEEDSSASSASGLGYAASSSSMFSPAVSPSKAAPPASSVSVSPPREVQHSSFSSYAAAASDAFSTPPPALGQKYEAAVSAFDEIPLETPYAGAFFESGKEESVEDSVSAAPAESHVVLSVDIPPVNEVVFGGPPSSEDYVCGFVDVDLNTPSSLPMEAPTPKTTEAPPSLSSLEVPQKLQQQPPAPSTSAKFVGKAQVISGASPFDVASNSPSVRSVDSLFGSAPAASSGGGVSSFLSPPSLMLPSGAVGGGSSAVTAASLFGGTAGASDVKATDIFSSLPPTPPVPQSSGTPRVPATSSSAPTAGGAARKKAPASAADIFNGSAPVAQPTTHDILSGPPPAPGVKVSSKAPTPFAVSSSGLAEKVLSPEQMAPAPEPKPVAAPTSAKKPNSRSGAAAPPAAGMIPTPHGFVSSKSSQATAAAAAPVANKVSAPLVSPALLNSLVAVQPEPAVLVPAPALAVPEPVVESFPPSAPNVSAGPPRPHGARSSSNNNSSSGGGASSFPPLPTVSAAAPRPVPKKIMKPPAAVACFGFGGRLLTMFPVAQVPINPMLMTPDQQARPFLPGPLRVHSTIDLVKQFCHIPISSSSRGNAGGSESATAGEDSEDTSSLSLLGHKQEAVQLCKLLVAFSGPLSVSVGSGGASFDSKVTSFIKHHMKRPTAACLSDIYFADDGTPGGKGAAPVSRHSITSSEQLLWSLLHIMAESNGNLSSEEGCSSPDSPESKIVSLLSGPNKSPVLPALEGMHRSFVEEVKRNNSQVDAAAASSSGGFKEDAQYQSTIENLLVRGQREEALSLALSRKDWTLAMLIGCVCGTDKYHSVVKQFADCQYPKESPLHLLSLVYSNQAKQHLLPPALLVSPSAAGGAGGPAAEGTSKKFVAYSFEKTSSSNNMITAGGETNETALTLWRSHLSAIVANKSADWKDLARFLGFRLASESRDIMAAHFAYLCSGSVPNYPLSGLEGASLSKRLGNYCLVGCNGSLPRHMNISDVVSVSALRMTELLEYFLLRAIAAAQASAAAGGGRGAAGDKTAGIASISKSITNLFGFGGAADKEGATAAGASKQDKDASSNSGASAEELARLVAQLKLKLIRVRAVLCPLKLRFALTLADFGLMKEAVAYAQEVRSVIMETAAYVSNGNNASAAAASQSGGGSAKGGNNNPAGNKSKKNPAVPPKGATAAGAGSAAAVPLQTNSKSFNGVKLISSRVIKVVEEFLERASPGERGGPSTSNTSSSAAAPPQNSDGSSKSGWGLGSMIGSINLKDLVDGGEASPGGSLGTPTAGSSRPPTSQQQQAASGPPPAMYSLGGAGGVPPAAGPWGGVGGAAAAPLPGNRVTPPPSSGNLMRMNSNNSNAGAAAPGGFPLAVPSHQSASHHQSHLSGGSENDFFVDVDLMSTSGPHSAAPSHSNSSNALFDHFQQQQQVPQPQTQLYPSVAPAPSAAGWPPGSINNNNNLGGSTPPANQYYSRGEAPFGGQQQPAAAAPQPQSSSMAQTNSQPFSGGFPPQSYQSGTNLDQMNNSSGKFSTGGRAPNTAASAPSPTAAGRSSSTSSTSSAATAAAAGGAPGGGGLFGGLRKGLINMMYGNDVKLVNEENIGGKMEAYFDKALGKWVFPGEDPSTAVPDPSSLPPPTMPSHNSLASLSSPTMSDSGPSFSAGGGGGGGGYDPLAAMMAPPARRIPSIASYSSMPGAAAPPSDPSDPLAAMMAPPSIGRYSQPATPSGGPAAPPVNMWRPPATTGGGQFMQVPPATGAAAPPAMFQGVSLSLADNDSISLDYSSTTGASEGAPPTNY